MGIIYTTYSYIASFTGKKSDIALTQAKINISANKLIHHLKLRQLNLQKKTKQLEESLINLINSNKMTRSVEAQQTVMSDIIMNSYLLSAYEQLIFCAKVIKTEAKQLETDSSKVSQRCVTCICTILYCYKALNLEDCLKLDELIPRPHPNIQKKHISQPLQEYVEYKKVDHYSLNIYALEMCYRNNIELDKINEAGHKFIYNPSVKKEEEEPSRSSVMFALDIELQDLQMMEKEEKMQVYA